MGGGGLLSLYEVSLFMFFLLPFLGKQVLTSTIRVSSGFIFRVFHDFPWRWEPFSLQMWECQNWYMYIYQYIFCLTPFHTCKTFWHNLSQCQIAIYCTWPQHQGPAMSFVQFISVWKHWSFPVDSCPVRPWFSTGKVWWSCSSFSNRG